MKLREIVVGFLEECQLPFPVVDYDPTFHEACEVDAHCRGWSSATISSIRPFLPGGVIMATTAYAHLTSESTRIFVALYTAALIYLDDTFQHDIRGVSSFNERFMRNEAQEDGVLEGFASLLREAPDYFGCVPSNIIVTSTLNLVTALSLEHGLQQTQVCCSFSDTWCMMLISDAVSHSCYQYAICDICSSYVWSFGGLCRIRLSNEYSLVNIYSCLTGHDGVY